ncbi:hypothetical protein KM043_015476 [Ampulex compressa]|nr:hypothetical protein KM043_015476 [Ampulex compressa]
MNRNAKKDSGNDVKEDELNAKSDYILCRLKSLFTCCSKFNQCKPADSFFDFSTNEYDYVVEKLVVKRVPLTSFVISLSGTQEKSKIVSNNLNLFVQSQVDNCINQKSLVNIPSNLICTDVLESNRHNVESLNVQSKKGKSLENNEKMLEDPLSVKSKNFKSNKQTGAVLKWKVIIRHT